MKKKLLVLLATTTLASTIIIGCSTGTSDKKSGTSSQSSNNSTVDFNKESNDAELTDEYLLSLPETPANEFKYEEIEGGVKITAHSGINRYKSDLIIVIPNEIDGKKVIELGDGVYSNHNHKAIVLNKNLRKIGDCFGKAKFKKVLIQDGIKNIGDDAFQYSKITEINIPDTVTTIGKNAFRGTNLKSIIIPKSVKTIGDFAFSFCDNLEMIIFEGCPEWGLGSFGSYTKLKKVICYDGNLSFAATDFCLTSGSGNDKDIVFVGPKGSKVEECTKNKGSKFEKLK